MKLLFTILVLLFSFAFVSDATLKLKHDILKDVNKLQQSKSYFISDNTTETASLEGILDDLKLFGLVANLDLSKANYTSTKEGKHEIQKWSFENGELKSITQLESNIHLDTVITQHYLENRPPSQHRIINDLSFRAYQISTKSDPDKLFYLTEDDQGLLAYKIGEKLVGVSYTSAKQGLIDLLPKYKEEVQMLLKKKIR
jgi:hypothetical protein